MTCFLVPESTTIGLLKPGYLDIQYIKEHLPSIVVPILSMQNYFPTLKQDQSFFFNSRATLAFTLASFNLNHILLTRDNTKKQSRIFHRFFFNDWFNSMRPRYAAICKPQGRHIQYCLGFCVIWGEPHYSKHFKKIYLYLRDSSLFLYNAVIKSVCNEY